jgi:hypothetical protein
MERRRNRKRLVRAGKVAPLVPFDLCQTSSGDSLARARLDVLSWPKRSIFLISRTSSIRPDGRIFSQ